MLRSIFHELHGLAATFIGCFSLPFHSGLVTYKVSELAAVSGVPGGLPSGPAVVSEGVSWAGGQKAAGEVRDLGSRTHSLRPPSGGPTWWSPAPALSMLDRRQAPAFWWTRSGWQGFQ